MPASAFLEASTVKGAGNVRKMGTPFALGIIMLGYSQCQNKQANPKTIYT